MITTSLSGLPTSAWSVSQLCLWQRDTLFVTHPTPLRPICSILLSHPWLSLLNPFAIYRPERLFKNTHQAMSCLPLKAPDSSVSKGPPAPHMDTWVQTSSAGLQRPLRWYRPVPAPLTTPLCTEHSGPPAGLWSSGHMELLPTGRPLPWLLHTCKVSLVSDPSDGLLCLLIKFQSQLLLSEQPSLTTWSKVVIPLLSRTLYYLILCIARITNILFA